ncbi:MAG: DUF4920 domain-containing protein [Planctomycetes bacterium]|nr:DUF4920 domain-containing protein [Planctomycetota bacterium]
MRKLTFLPVLFAFVACQSGPSSSTSAAQLDLSTCDQFGAGVKDADAVAIDAILADPKKYDGQTLRFSGPIQSICQTKGCWMRVGADDQMGGQNVFIKFKDYAFFMPLDGAGRTAVVEGTVAIKEIPVDQIKHYLEDAGKKDEAAKVTQPQIQVTCMASGVALGKR